MFYVVSWNSNWKLFFYLWKLYKIGTSSEYIPTMGSQLTSLLAPAAVWSDSVAQENGPSENDVSVGSFGIDCRPFPVEVVLSRGNWSNLSLFGEWTGCSVWLALGKRQPGKVLKKLQDWFRFGDVSSLNYASRKYVQYIRGGIIPSAFKDLTDCKTYQYLSRLSQKSFIHFTMLECNFKTHVCDSCIEHFLLHCHHIPQGVISSSVSIDSDNCVINQDIKC